MGAVIMNKIDYGKDWRRRKGAGGVSLADEKQLLTDDAAASFIRNHFIEETRAKHARKRAAREARRLRRLQKRRGKKRNLPDLNLPPWPVMQPSPDAPVPWEE